MKPLLNPDRELERRVIALETATPEEPAGAREVLTADRTYYVRTDGSDTNDGLVNSAGRAFLTISRAMDAGRELDPDKFNVVVAVADGTYPEFVNFGSFANRAYMSEYANSETTLGHVLLKGISGDPSLVTLKPAGAPPNDSWWVLGAMGPGIFGVRDIGLDASDVVGYCDLIYTQNVSQLYCGDLNFGPAGADGGSIFGVDEHSQISLNGAYTVDGVCDSIAYAITLADIFANSSSWTFLSDPAFRVAGWYLNQLSTLYFGAFSTTGTATGKRFDLKNGARIVGPGAPILTSLAGNVAGTIDANSQYQTITGTMVAIAFASLPASPVEGMEYNVTDSNTAVWGATVASGGANHVKVRYNGTNWTVVGK